MNKIKTAVKFANKYGIGAAVSTLSMIANLVVFSATENYTVRNVLLGVFFAGIALVMAGVIEDCL